jgi:hypothetical protein
MKFSLPIAGALLATVVTLSGGMRTAFAVECTGPFRQCAIAVNAQCSIDPDGKQRMTYWDRAGFTLQFETCAGRIFEKAGQSNPYKTGVITPGGLEMPYTELLYPLMEP